MRLRSVACALCTGIVPDGSTSWRCVSSVFVWLVSRLDCTNLGSELPRRRLRQVKIRITMRRRATTPLMTAPAMTAGLDEDDANMGVSLNGADGVSDGWGLDVQMVIDSDVVGCSISVDGIEHIVIHGVLVEVGSTVRSNGTRAFHIGEMC